MQRIKICFKDLDQYSSHYVSLSSALYLIFTSFAFIFLQNKLANYQSIEIAHKFT